MEFNNWNKEKYAKFIEYLKENRDEKYKEFHSSLVLDSKYEMIGIRLPFMRKIAKEISKYDYSNFLNIAKNNYYEEVMIQGLVIASIKNEKEFEKYFENHIIKIDNWALCDSFCNSVKIIRRFGEKYFKKSIGLALSEDEFISRTGLILILSHFISEKNLDEIYDLNDKIQSDKYYINMAQAWLLCELYIKFPEKTLDYLKVNKLNKFTLNKTISKICDSYRVSKETKEELKKLKK